MFHSVLNALQSFVTRLRRDFIDIGANRLEIHNFEKCDSSKSKNKFANPRFANRDSFTNCTTRVRTVGDVKLDGLAEDILAREGSKPEIVEISKYGTQINVHQKA